MFFCSIEATPPPAEGEASPAANQEPTDTPAPEEEQAEQPTADGSPGAAEGDASPAEGGEATPAEAEGQEGGEAASPGADGEKGEGDGKVKEGEEGKEGEEQKPAEGKAVIIFSCDVSFEVDVIILKLFHCNLLTVQLLLLGNMNCI